jgi:hypothetical protein
MAILDAASERARQAIRVRVEVQTSAAAPAREEDRDDR